MTRTDVHFSLEAEEYILERVKRLKSPNGLVEEEIVLFNVLGVEQKDQFGNVTKKRGPFVYVGLERYPMKLEETQLPLSGERVYLSGFDSEKDITIEIKKGRQDYGAHLCIDRG